ncbi:hypothetical protein JTE90_024421 [Oedothorax gibbosus]|uniref:DDE-1 domain-containing protein n=1 Tax=Oedothorax gibbosus TaxID=931172 RepID=A0AAV6UHQ7_9ARAC|nr:hypothetical protein JTE90_024421 [Oedothorax gibbosus]
MTTADRGTTVTMIATINAVGNSLSPFFIIPRVNFKDHMLKGAPPGSQGSATPSGWSNKEIFVDYLQHSIHYVKPSPDDPDVIILDNHGRPYFHSCNLPKLLALF